MKIMMVNKCDLEIIFFGNIDEIKILNVVHGLLKRDKNS